ncbi:MAG: oxidative damage protection protein [Gemmatimonadetes bacterium]|nr:oxidative damage protection protein [Gemmatimonadota bacterium]
MADVRCVRCQEEREGLTMPPFRSELGARIEREICQVCWSEWLRHQTQLINHYRLDVREASTREFLLKNLRAYLFGETPPDT